MVDKPEGTYALGVFLPLVRDYFPCSEPTITGFMHEFFNSVANGEAIEKKDNDERPPRELGPTSIDWGAWAGVNKKDLTKIYRGRRKIVDWKARSILQNLDQSAIEDFCGDIGIDALGKFQEELARVGIVISSIDELPNAVFVWLQEILKANAHNKDLLADHLFIQPELSIFQSVPLSSGYIAGNELHLAKSTLPWKPAPPVPDKPDTAIETTYIEQMCAAFGERLNTQISGATDLPDDYRQEFDEQRRYFYDAEGVRRNLRDLRPDGSHEFQDMKEDLYVGVSDTCRDESWPDGLVRMRKTLHDAAHFSLNGSVLANFPSMIGAAHKKGMCHMLVNDKRLRWVNPHG